MTTVGLLLFPGLTQLDLTGPYEVLARMPDTQVVLAALSDGPVKSEFGLTILPDRRLDPADTFDVLVVPGGPGVNRLLDDDAFLDCLAAVAARAQWITAVCTGALLLGAAGLLAGYRATTHWQSLELLPLVGATPVAERVVIDRNRITGGGISAGIDFGLTLAATLHGQAVAERIQLVMEYAPAPPFAAGAPATADPQLVREVSAQRQALFNERRASLLRRQPKKK
ncbi:MAG TPA: DJ-1/PfpI family protein [Pirellulales bacterium]|jgi:cyclohexyl-isocyanide hydratase|nr:DJ-1/PfpI family protein [Pirellulales bacterium]